MWKTLRAKPELSFRGCPQFQSGEDVTRWDISLRLSIFFNLNDPRLQFLFDGITNLSDFLYFLFMSTLQFGQIGEAPVKILHGSWKYGAPLGIGGIRNCNYVVETPAAFRKIISATSGVP